MMSGQWGIILIDDIKVTVPPHASTAIHLVTFVSNQRLLYVVSILLIIPRDVAHNQAAGPANVQVL